MSRFDIRDTPIAGLRHLTRHKIGDERGWLERLFCAETFTDLGWSKPINQINRTFTQECGTVRGLHFQYPPHAECKFVSCLTGKVFDIAVDLRASSPTFLQTYAAELSAENGECLMIPEGFAHGFQTLSNDVTMLYFHSAAYAPEHEDSVHPEDPTLKIVWPLDVTRISDRDRSKEFLSATFKGLTV